MKVEVPADSYVKLVDNKLFYIVEFSQLLARLQLDKAAFVGALQEKLPNGTRSASSVYKDLRTGNPVKNAEAKAARSVFEGFAAAGTSRIALDLIQNQGLIQPAFFSLPNLSIIMEQKQIDRIEFIKTYRYDSQFFNDVAEGRRVALSLALQVIRSVNEQLSRDKISVSPLTEITSDPDRGKRTAARNASPGLATYDRWPPGDGHINDLHPEDRPKHDIWNAGGN